MATIFIVGVRNESYYDDLYEEALKAFRTYEKAEEYRKEVETTYTIPEHYDHSSFYIEEVELEE